MLTPAIVLINLRYSNVLTWTHFSDNTALVEYRIGLNTRLSEHLSVETSLDIISLIPNISFCNSILQLITSFPSYAACNKL